MSIGKTGLENTTGDTRVSIVATATACRVICSKLHSLLANLCIIDTSELHIVNPYILEQAQAPHKDLMS